jgi:small nuclear ribonucleoprotein (snRNP)-like protein
VDQVINIVLEDCHERIYGEDGIEQVSGQRGGKGCRFSWIECFAKVPLGLFIIRGDNVAVIGEVRKSATQVIVSV